MCHVEISKVEALASSQSCTLAFRDTVLRHPAGAPDQWERGWERCQA